MQSCALICAYNEERVITEVVARARNYVSQVLVVDDGSRDRTYERSILAGAHVLKHPVNLGKGRALRTGISYFKDKEYDAIITLDADGQHLPEEIPLFIDKLNEGFDVVIGKRDFSSKNVPLIRKVSNLTYSHLLSAINHSRIYDPECGFRAFRKEILPMLLFSSNPGFSYESEILLRLLKRKKRIGWADISTVYIPGRKSRIKPFKHAIDSLKVCLECLVR